MVFGDCITKFNETVTEYVILYHTVGINLTYDRNSEIRHCIKWVRRLMGNSTRSKGSFKRKTFISNISRFPGREQKKRLRLTMV